MSAKQQKLIKAVFCSIPLPGHYIPLVRIAEALSQQSDFQVTFITSTHQLHCITNSKYNIKKFGLEDNTQSTKDRKHWDNIPVYYYDRVWEKQLTQYIIKQNPKVIVADFFSSTIMRIANQFKITTVIHVPGQSAVIDCLDLPLLKKNKSLLGVTFVKDFNKWLMPKSMQPFVKLGPYFDTSLVLISSFYGFDQATSLPPNFKLIGSTVPQNIQKPQFSGALHDWIEKMKYLKKNILYISFGSAVQLSQQVKNHLYYGLKQIDIAVLWSLKVGKIPQQNLNFFVSSWLPQVQILKLEQVKIVLTHCGWNGKTNALFPIFSDQPPNAKLVQKRGIGLILRENNQIILKSYQVKQSKFTHEQLKIKINQLLFDQKYQKNINKLYELMKQTGGIPQAIKLIRNSAINGIDHLIDKDINKIRRRSIKSFVFIFVLLLMFVILVIK